MPSKGFTHEAPVKGQSDIWLTPRHIIEALGPFDLDPCAAPSPRPWPTAAVHYDITQGEDGLMLPWGGGRVWCNPPYGPEVERWMNRMILHGNGIALVFARTETVAWQQSIFPASDGVLFLAGRVRFFRPNGTQGDCASAPSALIAFGKLNARILRTCSLKGVWMTKGTRMQATNVGAIAPPGPPAEPSQPAPSGIPALETPAAGEQPAQTE